jgi:hypothetical protein
VEVNFLYPRRKVTRPFRFRTFTLIPQVDGKRADKDEVSFG